jgi:uncharacterized membrane protein YfcA
MNEFLIISLVALGGSLLTFFSGFGLGTLLTPVFMLCGFSLEVAVSLTAIVHFLNNVFKLGLTFKNINRQIVLRFGLAAIPAAFLGSWLLSEYHHSLVLASYNLNGKTFHIELFRLLVAIVMIVFALREISPKLNFTVAPKWLPIGGILSGFFGGLSGHQGALRSSFLIKCRLSKESFIATGIAIACLIDLSRLSIYAEKFAVDNWQKHWPLLLSATLSAFAGALLGKYLLKKVTLTILQYTVSILLILFSFALALGWL